MLRKPPSAKQGRLAKRSKITVLCDFWLIYAYPDWKDQNSADPPLLKCFCTVKGKGTLAPYQS